MRRLSRGTVARRVLLVLVAVALVAAGIAYYLPVDESRRKGAPEPYHGDLPSMAAVNIRNAVLEDVYEGFDQPWAFEFISERELLVTEIGGAMHILDVVDGAARPVAGVPDIPGGKPQIGLMDVVLHPDFADNGVVYFSHAVSDASGQYATAVSRATLQDDALLDVEQIFVATPFGDSPANFGGALAFDDRGHLFLASGDRSRRDRSQHGKFLTGKIIRLTSAGKVPADNPFVGDDMVDDRIYALGVRNPQGLVYDAPSGRLFETEHGPMGGDEVNVIEAGRNYGWPVITYGADYKTSNIGVGTRAVGLEQPLYYFLPSIAVSPLAVYRGEMFREWEGDLLLGPLRGSEVVKLDLVDGAIKSEQRILSEQEGRVRDIKVAADGSIFILTQWSGRVYRLSRDFQRDDLEQRLQRRGQDVFGQVCASCHAAGLKAYPQLAEGKTWRQRLAQDEDTLVRHVVEGYGAMIPRGGCESCSDEEIRAAVQFLVEKQGKE